MNDVARTPSTTQNQEATHLPADSVEPSPIPENPEVIHSPSQAVDLSCSMPPEPTYVRAPLSSEQADSEWNALFLGVPDDDGFVQDDDTPVDPLFWDDGDAFMGDDDDDDLFQIRQDALLSAASGDEARCEADEEKESDDFARQMSTAAKRGVNVPLILQASRGKFYLESDKQTKLNRFVSNLPEDPKAAAGRIHAEMGENERLRTRVRAGMREVGMKPPKLDATGRYPESAIEEMLDRSKKQGRSFSSILKPHAFFRRGNPWAARFRTTFRREFNPFSRFRFERETTVIRVVDGKKVRQKVPLTQEHYRTHGNHLRGKSGRLKVGLYGSLAGFDFFTVGKMLSGEEAADPLLLWEGGLSGLAMSAFTVDQRMNFTNSLQNQVNSGSTIDIKNLSDELDDIDGKIKALGDAPDSPDAPSKSAERSQLKQERRRVSSQRAQAAQLLDDGQVQLNSRLKTQKGVRIGGLGLQAGAAVTRIVYDIKEYRRCGEFNLPMVTSSIQVLAELGLYAAEPIMSLWQARGITDVAKANAALEHYALPKTGAGRFATHFLRGLGVIGGGAMIATSIYMYWQATKALQNAPNMSPPLTPKQIKRLEREVQVAVINIVGSILYAIGLFLTINPATAFVGGCFIAASFTLTAGSILWLEQDRLTGWWSDLWSGSRMGYLMEKTIDHLPERIGKVTDQLTTPKQLYQNTVMLVDDPLTNVPIEHRPSTVLLGAVSAQNKRVDKRYRTFNDRKNELLDIYRVAKSLENNPMAQATYLNLLDVTVFSRVDYHEFEDTWQYAYIFDIKQKPEFLVAKSFYAADPERQKAMLTTREHHRRMAKEFGIDGGEELWQQQVASLPMQKDEQEYWDTLDNLPSNQEIADSLVVGREEFRNMIEETGLNDMGEEGESIAMVLESLMHVTDEESLDISEIFDVVPDEDREQEPKEDIPFVPEAFEGLFPVS